MPSGSKRKPTRAATLADVGRAAGVSAMAASAVLNGARTSSRIAPETRERILEAAARLRYRANAAARALAARRMHTIGVAAVIDSRELNQYFLEVFNGVLESAAERNQNTTVFALHDWRKDAHRLPGFCDGRIDGLILLAPVMTPDSGDLLPDHTPFVSIHANCALPNVVNLESDEEAGAYELVRHLVSLGHRRILHLAGRPDLLGAERRLRGYRRALADSGLPFDPDLMVQAGYQSSEGQAATREWLQRHAGKPLPDAIFCVNDSAATGCLEVLAASGIRVPDDVSVAGFDDTLAARTTVPQLTTVRQPLRIMGHRAVETLLLHIEHHHDHTAPVPFEPIVMRTELVIRNSVAPPARRKPSEPRETARL